MQHLVCFDLISQGHNAFLADQGLPYDVLVDLEDKIKRIQVKTCSQVSDHGKSKNVYRFSLRSAKGANRAIKADNVDYVAFVFFDVKRVQYIPVKEITSENGNLKQCIDFRDRGKTKYIINNFNTL